MDLCVVFEVHAHKLSLFQVFQALCYELVFEGVLERPYKCRLRCSCMS